MAFLPPTTPFLLFSQSAFLSLGYGAGYSYDANGNPSLDSNKAIDQISYNYLNLPQLVHMSGKGNIQYTYDAAGNKLRKVTTDSLSKHSTTTLYINGFVYQQTDTITSPGGGVDTLQFTGHEEGRARFAFHKYTNGSIAYGWEYDFFEKDHLGNTRVVLTQQKDTAKIATGGSIEYAKDWAVCDSGVYYVRLFGNSYLRLYRREGGFYFYVPWSLPDMYALLSIEEDAAA